jgi:hypothetical protein
MESSSTVLQTALHTTMSGPRLSRIVTVQSHYRATAARCHQRLTCGFREGGAQPLVLCPRDTGLALMLGVLCSLDRLKHHHHHHHHHHLHHHHLLFLLCCAPPAAAPRSIEPRVSILLDVTTTAPMLWDAATTTSLHISSC